MIALTAVCRPRQPFEGSSFMMTSRHNDSPSAELLREALVQQLRKRGFIRDDRVADAFAVVERHVFVPEGTPLEATYNVDDSVATKTDEHGVIVSSISAPFIQALMIEQSGLGPGMSVLEIGSGGYNAALLAEVVGPNGRVVSVDIDPEVTDRAKVLLEAAGYGERVTVVLADAEHGVPASELFDRIIVTVGFSVKSSVLTHKIFSGWAGNHELSRRKLSVESDPNSPKCHQTLPVFPKTSKGIRYRTNSTGAHSSLCLHQALNLLHQVRRSRIRSLHVQGKTRSKWSLPQLLFFPEKKMGSLARHRRSTQKQAASSLRC
ncbi:methyltransferase domain-containing protein [Streptosporangium sp. NPDC049046]|uniref:methyltransferase domain-containing protein n=1 Tax=Streptosporangium sp. NPDC049046 TaxID=3155031 RepID=UPI003420E009